MEPNEYIIMYTAEDTHWWYSALRKMIRLMTSALRTPPRHILDAGCGTGRNILELQRLFPNASVYGVDLHLEAVRCCKQRNISHVITGNIRKLPFPDQTFDLIVSCDVLYHRAVPDTGAALRELRRILRPQGYLLLNLPAYQWLSSSHDTHIHTAQRFTLKRIRTLLEENKFTLVRETYWNSILLIPAIFFRIWRRFFPASHSDVSFSSKKMFSAMSLVFTIERAFLTRCRLPFGLSVITLSQRQE